MHPTVETNRNQINFIFKLLSRVHVTISFDIIANVTLPSTPLPELVMVKIEIFVSIFGLFVLAQSNESNLSGIVDDEDCYYQLTIILC